MCEFFLAVPPNKPRQAQQEEAELSNILYGMSLGAPATRPDDDGDDDDEGKLDGGVRIVKAGNRVRCLS